MPLLQILYVKCACSPPSSYRREDAGLLVYKEHLPVSQVAVGDTNRPGSEAKLTVGPLRCQGDSKCCIHIYGEVVVVGVAPIFSILSDEQLGKCVTIKVLQNSDT